MRYFWLAVAFFSTLCIALPEAHAEHRGPVLVAIHCSCDDAIGRAYIDAVKTLIGEHPQYKQVAFDRSGEEGVLAINVISMPVESTDGKPHSVLSIVCIHDGSIVHQFIETCDRIPLTDCAKNMVDGLRDVL